MNIRRKPLRGVDCNLTPAQWRQWVESLEHDRAELDPLLEAAIAWRRASLAGDTDTAMAARSVLVSKIDRIIERLDRCEPVLRLAKPTPEEQQREADAVALVS